MRVYGVELSFNNREEVIRLPVNPSSIQISQSGRSSTYDVVGLGEIQVIKDRQLTEYEFSGLFPAHNYPFADTGELLPPAEYVQTIEKWLSIKRPIRFIFTSDTYEINMPVSIESFTWSETGGSGGDIEYSIKLKKYVFYAARKTAAESVSGGSSIQKPAAVRPNDRQQPKTYTMVAGDSLWEVAQTQLGNGARWKEIQKLNGIPDAELKTLPVGKVLKLP